MAPESLEVESRHHRGQGPSAQLLTSNSTLLVISYLGLQIAPQVLQGNVSKQHNSPLVSTYWCTSHIIVTCATEHPCHYIPTVYSSMTEYLLARHFDRTLVLNLGFLL